MKNKNRTQLRRLIYVITLTITILLIHTATSLAQGDTWTEKTGMNDARINFATVAVNGKIYAIGGLTTDEGCELPNPLPMVILMPLTIIDLLEVVDPVSTTV